MTAENAPSTRIGNDERNSAMAALDTHLEAGRLDAEEYGERADWISTARTSADLEPIFADLPAPHPVIGTPPGVSAPSARSGEPYRSPAVSAPNPPPTPAHFGGSSGPGRDDGREPLGGRVGATIVAVSPILAVILFFATMSFFSASWLFFLLIPAAGAIVYGGKWRGE